MKGKMMDRLNRGEFLVCVIRGQDTIGGIVSTIADYHYIYGKERSWFGADWSSDLREAITDDFYKWGGEKFFKSRRIIDAMLASATEYSAYDYYDRDGIIEACLEAGIEAYKRMHKHKFLNKLSGTNPRHVDW